MKLSISFLRKSIKRGFFFIDGVRKVGLELVNKLPIGESDVSISIDSRTIKKGEIFLALKGESYDASDFLGEVIKKGACGAIISESSEKVIQKQKIPKDFLLFSVPDTLKALISMAKTYRESIDIPVVAITGSVGKTTTKEILRNIFDKSGIPAYVSHKNQNTMIGLAINLLNVKSSHKVAIFEVGISLKGEMIEKAEMLRPSFAAVISIAHSHMEGLGSLEDIAQEKKKIFSFFKSDDIGVIFGDHKLLGDSSYQHPVVRFGLKTRNNIQARRVLRPGDGTASFTLKVYDKKAEIKLNTNHMSGIYNSLAAASIAHLMDLDFEKIVKGISSFNGFEKRFEKKRLKKGSGYVISDCYNANPESMKEAIMAVDNISFKGEKIAVLGDMLELGDNEIFWHRQIGRALSRAGSVRNIILVGERAKAIATTAPISTKIEFAKDWESASSKLENMISNKELLILVKASNGMNLENLVKRFSE